MTRTARFFTTIALLATSVASSGHAGQSQAKPLTIEDARRIVVSPVPGAKLDSISLAGFDFSREVEIGQGLRVIAVSCNWGGGLAAFRLDGSLVMSTTTGQITWLQLFDLNEDGISEVITEEVTDRGTGVLTKKFNLYKISSKKIDRLWQAESYLLRADWNPGGPSTPEKYVLGFLRFDPSGFGRKARMTYIRPASPGQELRETVYEMEGALLVERGGPGM